MKVNIFQDSVGESPREWGSNAGRMICFHGRYNLGDEHHYDSDDFKIDLACEWDPDLGNELDRLDDVYEKLYDRAGDMGLSLVERGEYATRFVQPRRRELIEKALERGVAIPLYLYDHSGISMNTSGFGYIWDSGKVGYIVCDPDTIHREFDGNKEKAAQCLIDEVANYDMYIRGDVWAFEVLDDDGEFVDGCGGFYGSDPHTNGMVDCLPEGTLDGEVVYQ